MLPTQQGYHLRIDNFDELLAWREAGQDVLTKRLGFNPLDEVLHYTENDVCLQQCKAHFSQGFINIFFSQLGVSTHAAQHPIQLFS